MCAIQRIIFVLINSKMLLARKGYYIIRNTIFTSNNIVRNAPVRSTLTLAFGKYLLITNVASSGVLMFLGDIIQQEIEYQKRKLPKRYDFWRSGRMFIVGITMGPIHHYYYRFINKVYPGTEFKTVFKKILLDQFVISPPSIAAFFILLGIMEGQTFQAYTKETRQKFLTVYAMDFCFWPPIQYVNFYFLSPNFQVIFINCATMIYNVLLSYFKYRDAPSAQVSYIK